ncbi:peptide/nickel transport system permease protein/dipeptide transport system permease protein [Rhizobium sp. BK529]|uniref:ABC transporter permease n=1 Tax=unclassified Rhizobium TaxID=2613769 RepID=UPI00105033BD|nr:MULTISPECIES: ABC transporter permease [unclassified Rhizobium]MBB3594250.1 peptide/nickel transport system permease protein/dipeptide transport system permease protein [Rhizobium sp. BK529]TCS01706.1 peptide/nickel transport system permease protein/dipeptide transport system permease protein [Rhizobium sp. BK418]
MVAYLIRRTLGLVAVLLTMSFAVFCLQSIIPADPARAIAGPLTPLSNVNALRQQLGLDDPIIVQYGRFLSRLAEGDLGTSVRTRQPVVNDIRQYLPASLELSLASLCIGLLLAGIVAILPHIFGGSGALRLIFIAAGSVPIFMSALLFVYFFWFRFGWLPGSGRMSEDDIGGPTGLNLIDAIVGGRGDLGLDAVRHLLLPACALALPIAVAVGRSLNSALHDVMQQAYIGTARGKGLREAVVVLRHGLRNAASPALAMIGLQVRLLFGNLLIVELVFGWPGLGLYMVQSLTSSDLPAVLGVTVVLGTFYILVNIVVEILQTLADPRIEL